MYLITMLEIQIRCYVPLSGVCRTSRTTDDFVAENRFAGGVFEVNSTPCQVEFLELVTAPLRIGIVN